MLDLIDKHTALERMQKALKEAGLDDCIDAEYVSYWLDIDEGLGIGIDGTINILSGMFTNERMFNGKELDTFTGSLIDLYNSINYREPNRETTNREGLIEISKTRIPPDEWTEHYSKAMNLLNSNKLLESSDEFEKVFEAMLEGPAASRDIFRVYFNASMAHLLGGKPDLGLACLKASAALNPNYTMAQERLEDLEKEETKQMIKLGVLKRMKRGYEEDNILFQREHYSNMSEQQLLRELEGIGVEISRRKFIDTAKRVPSKDELITELLYSQIPEESLDNDKALMIGYALWDLYCPEEPSMEKLMDHCQTIKELLDQEKEFDEIDEVLRKIEPLVKEDEKDILKCWSKHTEYISDNRHTLMEMFQAHSGEEDNRRRFTKLSECLYNSTGDPFWKITSIYVDETSKTKLSGDMKRDFPRFYLPHIYLYFQYLDEDDTANAHQSILDAIEIVEKNRKDDQVYTWNSGSLATDMDHVYDILDMFYDVSIVSGKRTDLLREGKKTAEEMIRTRDRKWKERFSEIIHEDLIKNPTIKYMELICDLGIDFTTEEEVGGKKINLNPFHEIGGGKKKVGRNDPCPCGSGKKFKHCCLRYDQ